MTITFWHFYSSVFVLGQLLNYLQCPWLGKFLTDFLGSFTYKPEKAQFCCLHFPVRVMTLVSLDLK